MSDEQPKAPSPPTIAMLTAGAGNMYCGSCLQDNAVAAAMMAQGHDIVLVPTYTPIRTDDRNVSLDRVFLGGINVYLQQQFGFFRHLPTFLDRWLDSPRLVRWAVSKAAGTDARGLGPLTISMLQGSQGHQRKEIARLTTWLSRRLQPKLVHLSNVLIAGCVPSIKSKLQVPVVVTLQGDDAFLDELPVHYRETAIAEIRKIAKHVDVFLVHSEYYRRYMSEYLGIADHCFRVMPLGISTDLIATNRSPSSRAGTVGYLARMAPEKGLHQLVDAFLQLRQQSDRAEIRLRLAGWHGPAQRDYVEQCLQRLRSEAPDHFQFDGEIDRDAKSEFFRTIDLLCVPSPHPEPKGLYVLESMAHGVPVVQPRHGAFEELIGVTQGGVLFEPNDMQSLVAALSDLLGDHQRRKAMGDRGRDQVLSHYSSGQAARFLWDLYGELIATPAPTAI